MQDSYFHDVIVALKEHQLLQALCQLKPFIDQVAKWEFQSEWEDINTSYHSLLLYMEKGMVDPDRNLFYEKFLTRTYHLSVNAQREHEQREPHTLYGTILRKLTQSGDTIEAKWEEIDKTCQNIIFAEATDADSTPSYLELDAEMATMFDLIWTSGIWNQQESNNMRNLMESRHIPVGYKAYLVSALMLSLCRFMDLEKFKLMAMLYASSESSLLKARSLIALVMVLVHNGDLLPLFPEAEQTLETLKAHSDIVSNLEQIQIQLFSLSRTEEAQAKIQDEIMPAIARSAMNQKNTFDMGKIEEMMDMDENEFNNSYNGEDSKELQDNISKLTQMQGEGIDLMFSSFRNLKSYPYFNTLSNWFRPFFPESAKAVKAHHPLLDNLEVFLSSLCDSDRYSFAFFINQTTNMGYGNILPDQIKNIMSEFPTQQPLQSHTLADYSRNTLQDLYRFQMLNGNRKDFPTFISKDHSLLGCNPYIARFFSQSQNSLTRLALAAYSQGLSSSALSYFRMLPADAQLSYEAWLTYGFCLQYEKEYLLAADCFLQASLQSTSEIPLNHLATCYRTAGNLEKAIYYYERLLQINSENTSYIFRYGECLFLQGNKEEALKQFYKADYLTSNSLSTQRAIAWCLLSMGNAREAETYYNHLLASSSVKPSDYLNAGHCAWAIGNLPTAIERYKSSHSTSREFTIPESDIALLQSYGISLSDIRFTIDILNMPYTIGNLGNQE